MMQQSDGNQSQQQQFFQLPSSWRLDIVDELCKPLAERLRFHFLEEQSGIMSGDSEGQNTTGNNAAPLHHSHRQTSKMDRLPEWLFRYLREVVENHGVHSFVMVGGESPLVDSVIDSLMVRASMMTSVDDNVEGEGDYLGLQNSNNEEQYEEGMLDIQANETTTSDSMKTLEITLQHLKHQYYSHSSTYFLREVARMARHALRAKSFFHHPEVVGSECHDRAIALRGIEQLFLFDSFLQDGVMQGEGEGYCYGGGVINSEILPPRMVDTFLSSNESLLQWWLEEEHDDIMSTLHQCALSTLPSYQSENEEGNGAGEEMMKSPAADESSNTNQQLEQLYPPISELFVALLHSARCKSNTFTDHRSRQMYIANVIAPLCSEYLDMVHAQAAWLRKRLLSRHTPTASSSSAASSGVSVLSRSSANIPSDDLLITNTMEWTSLITGTHLAAQQYCFTRRWRTMINSSHMVKNRIVSM
mmetsp:Transcript_12708/g.27613  ORF Transcript_12708/g.27613 Transcript_12708/m.27613 type:complete len:473 (+) Transcript_12708:764-2182(+)